MKLHNEVQSYVGQMELYSRILKGGEIAITFNNENGPIYCSQHSDRIGVKGKLISNLDCESLSVYLEVPCCITLIL